MPPDVAPARELVVHEQPSVENDVEADTARWRYWQTDGVARGGIERQNEGERPHEVWRIAKQPSALDQRLAYQGNVQLRQVADTPMHQLSGSAARPAGIIATLDQPNTIAARGGVQRHTR